MTKTNAARAVADTTDGVVLARVDIAVPPERVFKALTTAELTNWWGQADMYKTTKFTIDLRPGGEWRTEGVGADGVPFHVGGEVIEVDAPRKLVQTWKPSWEQGPATKVSYTLEAIATGTRVTVRHTGFTNPSACSDHANGWERVFGWLSGYLEPKPERRFYMVKLVPPRPSFAQDMSADERTAMQAHLGYCKSKLDAGLAIAFGPVADPSGAWGLGILSVPDEAAMRDFIENDPAIKANIGLRYESIPMINVMS
ncbi:MAG TPA: SRPBCC domain-containing protein [Kofleriaceae bacterium]|nr:SRPBCC domain-containing protein [Kofleriaceae bacterium]